MPKLTADSFLNVLQQSDLIERDRIKSLMGKMQESGVDVASSSAIGSWMVSNGHLTDWQVDKLQKRKHKGFRLGKYRLRKLLGKGGMSSVYLAEHTLMRRPCAIKVLPIKKVNDSSYLARFHREAQAVASLDHPNIVRAYDIDMEVEKNQEIHFLIMEYVKGRDLHQIVKEDGPLSFENAAEFCRQAALGLDHAHRSGLVHRDVKPGNLLLDENGVVKVLDLGLARFAEVAGSDEAPLTVAHDEKVLGTADYLSPEQALDSHLVDNRADVYSLGCSLYFALTGRPPFNEGTIAQRLMWHQMKEPPEMKENRADVPDSLAEITRRMMAKKPDDRYATMGDLATVLLNWLARNASADWKNRHAEILSGSDVAAPTAKAIAPVAAPVAAAAIAPPAAPALSAVAAAQPVAPTAAPVVPAATPAVAAHPVPPLASPSAPDIPAEPPVTPAAEGLFPGLPPEFGEPTAVPPVVTEKPVPVAEAAPAIDARPTAAPVEVIPVLSPTLGPADDPAEASNPTVDFISTKPHLPEPSTKLLKFETVAADSGNPDTTVGESDETTARRVEDDTQIDGPAFINAEGTSELSAPEATGVDAQPEQPGQVEILPAAESASGNSPDENTFRGLPDGATFADSSVNEPTLIAPPEPPSAGPFDFNVEAVPAVGDSSVVAPAEPVAAVPVEPVPAAASAAPAFPGPPAETAQAEFAPLGFNAAPAAQPVVDPTAPAPPPPAGGFDSTGFSPDAAANPVTAAPASTRSRKKSGPPVGLIAGIIAVLALCAGAYYMFGPDGKEGSGDGTTQAGGGGGGTTGQSGSTSGGSSKFLGYALTVGPEGNFKTFSALLKYFRDTKSSYRVSRRTKIVVTVSAGKYPESLVLDNSEQKYPEGIQLIVEGDSPAVLAPSGNGPVFKLTNVENFRLEGFEIDAAGRDDAVELNGDVDRSMLKNVTISGYSKAGIQCTGASGSVGEECVIEDVRFNPNGGNSVGIVFAESTASRFDILGCRFFGPQNSAIVFESSASHITVKDSIIDQAGMGITFAASDANLRNISVLNNTFHDCSTAGLHFAAAPSEESFGSSEIAVHRNIFSKLGGAEAIIEKGYELKAFQKFVSTGTGGVQFNWSDRPTAANQTTEWEIVLRPEQRVSSFQFVTTDRSSPDYLRPAIIFTKFSPGGGSQRYPGAVKPK